MQDIAIIAAVLVVVASVRDRIAGWPLTPPMLFVGAGMLLGPGLLGAIKIDVPEGMVISLTEVTLALLLFADASRVDISRMSRRNNLPARLLGIGLPLTIALGTAIVGVLLVDLDWVHALLVGAVLAPTDAALGEAVVTDERVPLRIRQGLNVESGVNDGMVVPVVTVALALLVGEELDEPTIILTDALKEIVFGVFCGFVVGFILGRLLPWLRASHWAENESLRFVAFGGAIAAWAGAEYLGGNGFIGAFIAGMTLRSLGGEGVCARTELVEDVGTMGSSAAFIWFGATVVWPAMEGLTVPLVLCVLALLTVARMVPVAIALIGSGLRAPTVAFMGWFGPRGLASMLFGLLIREQYDAEDPVLFHIIALTVFASVVLHGVTAAPWAAAYGRWWTECEADDPDMAEGYPGMHAPLRGARKG